MTDPIQIESPMAQINRARYAGKDFFTFVDDIVARIQTLFVTEFNDFVVSGTGQMLIDIVAWACETLSFYIDRQAAESYLSTARTRKAVNRLSRQIGYKMAGAVAASVDLTVNLGEVYSFNVPVPVGYQLKGPNGLVFEAVEEVIFPAGEGPSSPPRTVATREGVSRVEVFTSNGTRNQVFRLNPGDGKFVAEGTVVIRVGGVAWEDVELITFDQTDQVEIDFNSDPTTIRFGDGVAGNVPVTGAEIRVSYIATSGKSGLVQHNTITEGLNPLVVMFQEIELVITNERPSSGGADAEDLISAKAKAPRYFKARNVAVTKEDYVGLSQAYADPIAGAVSVAQAFVARGADDDIHLQILLNNIRGISLPLSTDVQALTAGAESARLSIVAENTDIQSEVDTALLPSLDAIVTNALLPAASGDAIDCRVAARAVRVASSEASVRADEGLADGTLGGKNSALTDIKTLLSSVESEVQTIVDRVGTIEQSVFDARAGSVRIGTAVSTIVLDLAAIETSLLDIVDRVDTNFETAIETQLQSIFDHVDGFLSDDCKANLVQVPILTRDVDGFLTEPPIALMRSLERFLNARKEVTQVVEVVSGGPYLVRADIVALLGILDGYVQATVISNVRKALDDLLRVRPFGKSLRLSDLYAAIVPNPATGQKGVDGVSYANFEITGPALYLDASGNLIIEQKRVVTKGVVTLTGEVAT